MVVPLGDATGADLLARHGRLFFTHDTGCALELEAFALLFASDDAREGTRAFVEKRPAVFRGR